MLINRTPSKSPANNIGQGLPTLTPSAQPTSIPKTQDISYHNGTVMVQSITIYNIYFGPFKNSTMDLVDYFAT